MPSFMTTDKSDCSNYRGITLLLITGKVLVRILLNRFVPTITEGIFPVSQCSFRANRSTNDMVLVLRQLQEKCREQNKGLYVMFVESVASSTTWDAPSCRTKADEEIDNRLSKDNCAFGWLYKRVWNNRHLKKGTEISVYKAVVLSTLLYGSESWVTYLHHLRLLERFHQCCLRTILNIHWKDFVTNTEVLEKTEVISIKAMLLKTQLHWAGHVSRMEENRLPKIVLYSELNTGQHDKGAPKKRYKDSLKTSLNACCIDHRDWTVQT
ncbi:hypothetical protein QTP70_018133 [Hemibagrus guttatus]|uniref:Reverse transcriptase domain-containing protein n=1 Tax=Hemibagrus guttatus TaxID=175788 RepID=A0AAE0QSW8_9TELE|nr:hypothetical protein QTP70_018133 [Hemibagrus guttatus]